MSAYYNEFDKDKAAWIRELIKEGVICDGEVDERDIKDINARDFVGFDRVHLFSGIATWDYALTRAGYRDERTVWTISCPCPPFSVAGKQKLCPECNSRHLIAHPGRTGFFVCCMCNHEWLADERHLWPEVWRLIRDGRPGICFGEQVWSSGGKSWFGAVRASMEILGYACRGYGLCSPAVGGSDIRRRLYFSADGGVGHTKSDIGRLSERKQRLENSQLTGRSKARRMANDENNGRGQGDSDAGRSGQRSEAETERRGLADGSDYGRLDNATGSRHLATGQESESQARNETRLCGPECGCSICSGGLDDATENRRPGRRAVGQTQEGRESRPECDGQLSDGFERSSGLYDFWPDTVWIPCNDPGGPKLRPVQAVPKSIAQSLSDDVARDLGLVWVECADGTQRLVVWPLIEKGKNRRLRISGYGDAVNCSLATAFIKSYLDIQP